jgi:hypothetical protein
MIEQLKKLNLNIDTKEENKKIELFYLDNELTIKTYLNKLLLKTNRPLQTLIAGFDIKDQMLLTFTNKKKVLQLVKELLLQKELNKDDKNN